MILDEIPEFLDRVELWAIRWQHDRVDSLGDLRVAVFARMEARTVPDNDVLLLGKLSLDLFQEGLCPVEIDARGLDENSFAIDDVERPVTVAPRIFTLP